VDSFQRSFYVMFPRVPDEETSSFEVSAGFAGEEALQTELRFAQWLRFWFRCSGTTLQVPGFS